MPGLGGVWCRGWGGCLVQGVPGWGMPGLGGACSWGYMVWGVPGSGGAWSRGPGQGGACSGVPALGDGVPGGDPQTATAKACMHPTGMHSCLFILL